MPKIAPEIETFARIRVIGVGGSGKNATNHMITTGVKGVDFIAVNCDAQDLQHSHAKKKIHIGKNLTHGLGAGMNPDIGRRAAEDDHADAVIDPLPYEIRRRVLGRVQPVVGAEIEGDHAVGGVQA